MNDIFPPLIIESKSDDDDASSLYEGNATDDEKADDELQFGDMDDI